jgi:hypothetical protein
MPGNQANTDYSDGHPLEANTPLRSGTRVSLLDGLVTISIENDVTGIGYRVENNSTYMVEIQVGAKGRALKLNASSSISGEILAAKLPALLQGITENDFQLTVQVRKMGGN